MKQLFYALAVCLMFLLALPISGCDSHDVIKAGIEKNNLPLSYSDGSGKYEGFEVDLAREAGKRMGREIQFVPIDMDQGYSALNSGFADVLWGGVTDNYFNSDNMLLSSPYLTDNQVVIVKRNSTIDSLDGLKGKTVGAVRGTQAERSLKDSPEGLTLIDGGPKTYNENITLMMDLDSGKIDAAALNNSFAQYRMAQHEQAYSLVPHSLSSVQYCVAVRRNDSKLLKLVQSALDSMKKDGTAAKISIKWFSKDLTAK